MSFSEQPFSVSKDFLSVAEKFDKDRRVLDDTNAFFSCGDCYGVRKGPPATSLNILTNFVHSSRDGPVE